jgi:hemoglobin/transferrin/lactoferrin receptor protein
MMRYRLVGLPLIAATAAAGQAVAQDLGAVLDLDLITVTASKTGTDVFESPSASSVIGPETLATLPDNLPDILQTIPSVTTQTVADDPAVAVNIRGLQDFGRVNVLIDGARQSFQKSGHSANGSFYFDPEMLQTVDVTRGPVSSVYGSGAIGGVASFTTIDADSLLDPGEQIAARFKAAFETNPEAPTLHGEIAVAPTDAFDIIAAATWRDAADYTSGAGTAILSAQDLLSGLVKARIRPADGHETTLSALQYHNDFDNGLSTLRATTADAGTYTIGHTWQSGDLIDLSLKAYYNRTDLVQTDIGGATPGAEQSFAVGTLGADVFNTSRFDWGPIGHELTYGFDIFRDDVTTEDMLGSSDDLTPSGTRLAYGAFVQDRIDLNEALAVIGAFRYDAYRLSDGSIEVSGGRPSPKLTVEVKAADPVTLYATYAEGYRAPAVTETLIEGFHPPPVSGEFLPNPDLRPEVARSIEAGVNLDFDGLLTADDRLRLKAGVFHSTVDDYIEMVFEPFPIPGAFRYVNLSEAVIDGFEIEALYDGGDTFAGLSGQVLDGTNALTGEGLVSVPPNRAVVTFGVRTLERRLEVGTRLTAVASKPELAAGGYLAEAYQLVDVFANWKVNDRTTASLTLSNLFDTEYTQYLNGQPSPGFGAKFTLAHKFSAD